MSSDKPREAVLQDTEKQSTGHGTGERQRRLSRCPSRVKLGHSPGSMSGFAESGHGSAIYENAP
jgi:hypothetical protein